VTAGRLISASRSTAFLPEAQPLRRLPRSPDRQRPAAFHARYEDRALVYDCFRHADGQRILLAGPPPMNLAPQYREASYVALPSAAPLAARHHASLSTMLTELSGAPDGTTAVRMTLAGNAYDLPLGDSLAEPFRDRRIAFTMSRNNDLAWIAEWARWHRRMQGADAVVLFDNGSTRYDTGAIEETLLAIDGLERIAVVAWPGRYGMTDPALRVNPFYVLFLQVSAMGVALRRIAPAANGLMNCDIDELVATPQGTTAFELARASGQGLLVMRGRFIEPLATGGEAGARTHRHYLHSFRDPRRAASRPKKWVLDPSRPWVRDDLAVHPYMHWIEGRPWWGKSMPPGVFYRHFRAINTGWKDDRAAALPDPSALELDAALAADFARMTAS
jgi:hypothetical protein